MKKILLLILVTMVALSCGTQEKTLSKDYLTLEGFAEGTSFKIIYKDSLKRDLRPEINAFFEKFENSLSIYKPNSLVSRINGGDTTAQLDEWFIDCFNLAREVSSKTDGLLDITLRPLIAAYGFGGKAAIENISQAQIDSILNFVGYEKVSIKDGKLLKEDDRIELDFNAIAKGYSVDLLGKLLESHGIDNYLVEVGGEIVCKGISRRGNEWNVAIDKPYEGNYFPGRDVKATIRLNSGQGLATSGNYRKFKVNEKGEMIAHTIDPRTGKPASHNLLSATIVAPSCGEADAFATACMVSGLDGAKSILARNPQLDALFIYSEGDQMRIFITERLRDRISERK